jgi:hypothetical protein
MKIKLFPTLFVFMVVFNLTLLAAMPILAAGPSATTSVNGVTDVTSAINTKGIFTQDINASSDDNTVLLHVLAGSTGLVSNGTPLTHISIIHMTAPPTFQNGAGMVTLAYDFQPSGATFDPLATVTFNYNPISIPTGVAATDLQIAYYDATTTSWTTVAATVDTASHSISAQITHFTPYAVTYGVNPLTAESTTSTTTTALTSTTTLPPTTTTPVVTPAPAKFKANSLIVNPSTVKPGEKVNVYLTITNVGDINGTDTVVMKLNNLIVDSKDVNLDGGVSNVVTFSTSSNVSGNYLVEVAGLDGNFTVLKNATSMWFWPVAAGAFVLGIIIVVVLMLLRNK